jgi:hypothetical protein
MPRKRIFVGFGGVPVAFPKSPETTLHRAAVAQWHAILLFLFGISWLIPATVKRHFATCCRVFVAALLVYSMWYATWHPGCYGMSLPTTLTLHSVAMFFVAARK